VNRPHLLVLALASVALAGCPAQPSTGVGPAPATDTAAPPADAGDAAEFTVGALTVDATPADGAPQQGGTLAYGRGQDSVSLDPADITDGESVKVTENIFQGLVAYKPGSTEVEPCLATGWKVSEDRRSWTFTLRQGVKFHDGTALDADAVVFSCERQRDPEHPFHHGEFVYWTDQFSFVEKVEKTGPLEVKFTLSTPFVPFLSNLAMFTASIISPAHAAKVGKEGLAASPVGTGPFKLVEWRRKDGVIVLEAFDGCWSGRPPLDRVVFRAVADNTSRLQLLKKGELQGMDGLNPTDVKAAQQDEQLRLLGQPGMNVAYLAINCQKKPFDDPRVRKAVALALDLERIAGKIYHGLATPAKNPLPPTLWGHADEVPPRKADREAAKKLLAEAGQSSLTTELWTMTNPRPYMPQPDKVALYIKAALQQVGVTVTIVPKEWASYLEEIQKGEHPMCLMGWTGDNGDPDNFLYVLLSKASTTPGKASNYSFYRSDPVSELFDLARVEPDQSKRAALYRLAQVQIAEDVPMIPLVHSTQTAAFRKDVRGFRLHPTGVLDFSKVWLAE
jgi:peptide/nickel transport system substrate-binding protein